MMFQEEETQKKKSFQEAANSWRMEIQGKGKKSGKRAENNVWGKKSAAKDSEKDHTGLYKIALQHGRFFIFRKSSCQWNNKLLKDINLKNRIHN